jgi:hypothetical protein
MLYDENNDDNYSDEDENNEDEEDYTDEQYEEFEDERIRLNGSRWLFMRAEGIEIHPDDNEEDYNEYDEDDEEDDEEDEEDEYEEDDEYEDDEYEDDEEENEENERIMLNGSRWLFMRAEGDEIHRFDNDDYEFDENDYNYEDYNLENNNEDNYDFVREPALSGVNISINDITEKIIQKGVTYKELLVLLIGFNIYNESDIVEYSKRQLNEIKEMIYNISDGISN